MSIAEAVVLTVERLREALSYDRETGEFRWRCGGKGVQRGALVGTLSGASGGRRINLDKTGISAAFKPKQNFYQAGITVSGKFISLGCFKTADEAHDAYVTAKRQLHEGCTI